MSRKPEEPAAMTETLCRLLRIEYDACRKVSEIEIKPTLLAERVRKRLDKKNRTPILLAWAGTLTLRRLGSQLTSPGDRSEDDDQQERLFRELQRYYPAFRHGEYVRVLREHLTVRERRKCANTMRLEAASKIAHADALDAETDALLRAGRLFDDEGEAEAA